MAPRLEIGRIIWAEIADANGVRKLRPGVVVTATADIAPGKIFDVVAVTSRLDVPLPADHVLLPWDRRGHPRTKLARKCAAVCTWLAQLTDEDIQDMGGIVPSALMSSILSKVAQALKSQSGES